jgi:hypothetical protein
MSILTSQVLTMFRYVVSDCDSVDVLFTDQHYTKSPEEAAAVTINAGIYIASKCAHFRIGTNFSIALLPSGMQIHPNYKCIKLNFQVWTLIVEFSFPTIP